MITQIYNDMDHRAKKVGDMDRKARLSVIWDLAEGLKVSSTKKFYEKLHIFIELTFFVSDQECVTFNYL